jgi:gliding motility-associated lipoprotein GldH
MTRYLALLIIGAGIIAFSSCDSLRIFEENKKIPDGIWDNKNNVSFTIHVSDTITPTNVYVNVRHRGDYAFSNLFLFITSVMPNGQTFRDTAECILADHTGNWKGDGLGDIKSNRLLFKKNVRFPVTGTYRFDFEQAMRTNPLPGILDVGMRVEKAGE